ncbi:glycosyltransferase family 2 protein [Herbaspirillum sp. DW155]|uniref:glycosyltransferase family 2 protein n=1 Tax=Herbaspirillum sp. DW155 TaxID=3095609 RepID=UPI003092F2D3|nr:glycosyltransferase family 2 protein [Herbaspirillum sp. DW155]
MQSISHSNFGDIAGQALSCGIVMCTCNGMPYLAQQLDSLLQQDTLPDQIAIFDDASDDGTWEYVQQWAANQQIPLRLRRNESRLGVVRNFEAAVQAVDTDIVFLCDQDDIWLPFKLRLLREHFEKDPALTLVHTDARLVDSGGHDMQASLFQSLGVSSQERAWIEQGRALDVLCRRNIVTGATAAFRRELLDVALPFAPGWVHDEWLAALAAATGKLKLEERSTILYRQHGRNAIGMEAPGVSRLIKRLKFILNLPRGKYQAQRLMRVEQLRARLDKVGGWPADLADMLQDWFSFVQFGATLPDNAVLRMVAVLRRAVLTGHYRRFGRGSASALRDIIKR